MISNENNFNECMNKFIEYIESSKNIVFFGGAGVSTDSGIPDFRSKDGLYNQHDIQFENYTPEYLLSSECLFRNPKVFFDFYRQKLDTRNIEPNITHIALSKLEELGKLKSIITQNIDGLHQKAGSKCVREIHGTTTTNYCNRCKKQYDSDYINVKNEIPKCECGGIIRPDVTLYGEQLPGCSYNALEDIRSADMLIIAGTSLQVYPAASFITYFNGEHIIVINNDILKSIHIDDENDIFFQCPMKDVFSEIYNYINNLTPVVKEWK